MKRKVILALLFTVGVTTFSGSFNAFAESNVNLSVQQKSTKELKQITEDTFEKKVVNRGYAGKSVSMRTCLKTSDNNTVVLYTIKNYLYLEKVDKGLNTVWLKTYDIGDTGIGANYILVEEKNGDILFGTSVTGVGGILESFKTSSYTPEKPSKLVYIAKFNSDGDLINGRILANDNSSENYSLALKTLIPMEDGKIGVALEAGYSIKCEGYSVDQKGSIFILDSEYDIVSESSSNFDTSIYYNYLKKSNGDVIVASGGDSNYVYLYNSNLVKTNSVKAEQGYYINMMKEKENGDVLIFCSNSSSKGNGAYILTVNSNGDITDVKDLNSTLLVKSIVEKEGGYYLCGQYSGSTIVMETDSEFNNLGEVTLTSKGSTYVRCGVTIGDSAYLFTDSSSKDLGVELNGTYDAIFTKITDKSLVKLDSPTIEKLEDGKIKLIDNSGLDDTKMYYRYVVEESTRLEPDWIEYTAPFSPVYNKDGSLKIEAKVVSESSGESEIAEHTDFNADYVETETDKNVDVMFTLDDTLSLRYENNTIDFGSVSGLTEKESTDNVVITVSSSKPWDLSIKALTDFIGQTDSTNIVEASKLSAKANEGDYKSLIKGTEVTILEDQEVGMDIQTNIKFKLSELSGAKSDTYKMTTRVKVTQK